ncbi:MAG: beta-galactosidase, partial [Hadesarchaea archaeon]|nr:beta-galactosidase [Hadesarchaea archaeon]
MIKFLYDGFYIDDERIPVYSGAVHYWRLDPKKWGEILDKVKGMGFEVVTTYIPWEVHEIKKGVFDFGEEEPSKDIGKYLTICEEKGLKVLVRPGPQINSELTWFGYPKRILEDSEIQARSAQNTKAVLTQVPRPIPALSYASEKFFKETAEWYDAICSILRKHKAPQGCIIGVQVDNELGYFFHINPYVVDYSNSSIKKYQEFLREKYQTIENLNGLYRTNYESFEEIDPPRRFEGRKKEDLPYYIDWIEYREHYLINSLDRLTGMMRERGLDDVPIFHNYPHPLGPGGSVGATTTPFNLPELESKLDFVGFDIYSRKELYDHVKTIVSYVVGCSRFPFIPEFIAGVWPWYFRPGELNDEEFVTKSALMHGIKGFSRYMIVERNRWMGSPVTRDGRIREDRYNFFKQVNEVLKKHSFADFKKKSEIMLISNRDYDRLEAATVLIPFPGDFLETLLGFSEYPNFTTVSEDNFGFDGPIQLAKTKWFDAYYRGLTEQGY